MKIKKEEEKLVLSGNELFGAIGIVAIFFFCVGIRLLIACIWPEDGITDWFGTALVAIWTCLALWMALRGINDALTCLVLDENMGAFRALKTSAKLTSRSKWELAKLDLHFWWYYALQVGITVMVYTPELCALAGITLPVDADTAYWLSYGAYAVAQIALLTLARPQVEVAFAGAYDCRKAAQ